MTFDLLRIRFFFICVGVTAAWTGLANLAHAQDKSSTAAFDSPQPSAHSFEVRFEVPEDIRDLLERHLQLQRFRAVTDIEDAEL